ncbi:MAG: Immunity protein 32, partial [Bacteroidota bacterium]
DKEGLEFLRAVLNKDWSEPTIDNKELYDFDHEHLSSKDWGGEELTPEYASLDSQIIHSVKLIYLGVNGKEILS